MEEKQKGITSQIVEAILFVIGFAFMFFALKGFLFANDTGTECEKTLWKSLAWLAAGFGCFLGVSHIGTKRKTLANKVLNRTVDPGGSTSG